MLGKKRLGIDLDGTLADTQVQLLRVIEEKYGVRVTPESAMKAGQERHLQTSAEIAERFGITKEQVQAAFVEAWKCYTGIPLVHRDIPSIMREAQKDFEVCILTATYGAREHVEAWLKGHGIPYDRLIMLDKPTDKADYSVDVHIDDSPIVARLFAQKNLSVILLGQRWNQDDQEALRREDTVLIANGWHELKGILKGGYERVRDMLRTKEEMKAVEGE